jgi:endonuclease YncB( thermonuclease family)
MPASPPDAGHRPDRPSAPTWRVLALGLLVAGCAGDANAATPPPPAASDAPWAVTTVIDGDTLRATASGLEETVRLVGINAPEHGECWADEATIALGALVGTGSVRLVRDVSDRDQYGRLLRYVLTADGQDVGGLLIDGGDAFARAYPPDTSRDAEYRERQRVARESGLGAWARDACGTGPASAIDPATIGIEVHPDAAGDDASNLDDEWVRFTNLAADALDLDGWTVRNESSSHRYRFAALTLPPGGSVTLRSGCGVDTDTERHWCVSGSAVWNNAGDTVFLLDPAGNVVTQLGYPDPAAAPRPSGWP